MNLLSPAIAHRRADIPEGHGGLYARTALAAATVLYALVRFGWYAGAVTAVAAAVFVLADRLQHPHPERRPLALRCLLITLQTAVMIAPFIAPRPFGFASDMPVPMALKTPLLMLLGCFMVSQMTAARPFAVIWTGLSVIAGWLLIRVVIRADPLTITAAMLNFAHYKTWLALARAASVPHFFNNGVFAIQLRELMIFGAVLAFASYRVHFLALRTARQAALHDSLVSHFSPQIADLMVRSKKPGLMRWAKDLAVLDCDMVGFTAIAERLAPERVAATLEAYRNFVAEAVFRADGAIVSFTGDGITAVFGLTESAAPEAVAALDCALAIAAGWRETAQGLIGAEAPAVAIGVDFGPVRAGLVGEGRALSLLMLGEPVNGAARLQAMTRDVAATILVSDAERRAVEAARPVGQDRLVPVEVDGATVWSTGNG